MKRPACILMSTLVLIQASCSRGAQDSAENFIRSDFNVIASAMRQAFRDRDPASRESALNNIISSEKMKDPWGNRYVANALADGKYSFTSHGVNRVPAGGDDYVAVYKITETRADLLSFKKGSK